MYETADGRHLTVGALEPKLIARLCELLGHPEWAERQLVMTLRDELAETFSQRRLADWLQLFRGEDVCVGPVATRAEAREFASPAPGEAAALGAHTEAWRTELGL
jgi:crotonobetainyl-CoA:carnitine CoA-transferase CaiB-like acyl-CoA transferase